MFDKETLKKFKGNVGALKDARSVYNMLCKKCQRMVFVRTSKQKEIKVRHYCLDCQRKMQEKFGGKYS